MGKFINCKREVHNNHSPNAVTITQQRAEDGEAPPMEVTSSGEAVPDKVVEDTAEDIVELVAEVVKEVSASGL